MYCVVRVTVSVGFSLRFDKRSEIFFVLDLVLKLLPGFTVSVGFSLFITVTVLHYPQPGCADSVGFSLCITVRI